MSEDTLQHESPTAEPTPEYGDGAASATEPPAEVSSDAAPAAESVAEAAPAAELSSEDALTVEPVPEVSADTAMAAELSSEDAPATEPVAEASPAPEAGEPVLLLAPPDHESADAPPAAATDETAAVSEPKPRRAARKAPATATPALSAEAPPVEGFEVPVGGATPVEGLEVPMGETTPVEGFEVPVGGAASAYHATSFWSERPDALTPPATADSLYEAAAAEAAGPAEALFDIEVDVRSRPVEVNGERADVQLQKLATGLLQLVGDNLRRMTDEQIDRVNAILRSIDLKDYLDPDFWKGIGMVLRYQIDEQVSFVQRRLSGEYSTDPYGLDREVIEIVRPFMRFMYRTWWRVEVEGLERVPAEGRALLVANHSGVLPWDGAMIATAVAEDHPAKNDRIVRSLHLHWFSTLPFVAPALAAVGQVPGLPENAVRLLESDELVCVFPEGLKGVGKLYKDRYKLARFGRGGFVQAALRAQAPLIPVAVVGAEEIYPMLADAQPIARLLGMPYFPITPFFPWLGPLGVVPLPTHWSITFCEPLHTEEYDPAAADDPLIVLGLTEMVRERIQATIDAKLAERKSIF